MVHVGNNLQVCVRGYLERLWGVRPPKPVLKVDFLCEYEHPVDVGPSARTCHTSQLHSIKNGRAL